MPEDFTVSKKLINVSDEDRSDASEDDFRNGENVRPPSNQKMSDIVQNFFNSPNISEKYSNKEVTNKKNKCAELLARVMCHNIKQNAYINSNLTENKGKNSPKKVNNVKEANKFSKNAGKFLGSELSRKSHYTEVSRGSSNEEDEYEENTLLLSKNDQASALSSKEVKVITPKTKVSGIYCPSGKLRGGSDQQISSDGTSNYENIRESQSDELLRRHAIQQKDKSPSTDEHFTKSKTKRLPRLRKFMENNVRKLWIPRTQSGSVVLLNEKDTNMKFSEFKQDIGLVVDETVTSQRVKTHPDLLSGGEVILEEFAERFKPRNYYVEDPLTVEYPSDIAISKLSEFNLSLPEPLVLKPSLSGGSVTDISSKGVSLPDLYPSKQPVLKNCRPTFERHLSGGELVESEVQNSILLDILSKNLKVEGLNSSQPESTVNQDRRSNSAANALPLVPNTHNTVESLSEGLAEDLQFPNRKEPKTNKIINNSFESAFRNNSKSEGCLSDAHFYNRLSTDKDCKVSDHRATSASLGRRGAMVVSNSESELPHPEPYPGSNIQRIGHEETAENNTFSSSKTTISKVSKYFGCRSRYS